MQQNQEPETETNDAVDQPDEEEGEGEEEPLEQDLEDEDEENDDDDESNLVNPDLDRPSPPRNGSSSSRVDPFDVGDDADGGGDGDCAPLEPEKVLSPNHVFEDSTLEEELLKAARETTNNRGGVNSATFVRQASG